MKAIFSLAVFLLSLPLVQICKAGTNTDTSVCPYDCCRPDGHAPLGIMTDHVHGKGEWGFSYSYVNIQQKGNQTGTALLTDQQVLTNYMTAPDQMTMQMHMAMIMYGLSDRLSLMGMFSFVQNSMQMTMNTAAMSMPGMVMTGTPTQMNTKTSGLGDTKIYGLYKIADRNRQRLIFSLGINIPTGSTTINGLTLEGDGQRLSYPMQTGTGTWDLIPALAYTGQINDVSWGLQTGANLRPGLNMQGYALGDEFTGNAWISYRFSKWMSSSLRLEENVTTTMNKYDPNIAILAMNDPTANAANYGGEHTNAYLGLNFYKPSMPFRGNRLMLEYGIPVYQNLNGTQMKYQSTLCLGWQYNF